MKFNPPNIWKNTKIEEKNEFFHCTKFNFSHAYDHCPFC